VAKKSLRDLLIKINKEEGTTIFLTSHDVGDIESLCERTIVINHGSIIKDLPTKELAKTFLKEKNIDIITVLGLQVFPELPDGLSYTKKDKNKVTVMVDTDKISVRDSLRKLLDVFEIDDLDVYDTDLETIIRNIYKSDTLKR